jgi:hypothetical protein
VDQQRDESGSEERHPAIHVMCQNPATVPTKAPAWPTTCATVTVTDGVPVAAEGLLPAGHHESSEERDRHRERDDGDRGRGVERWSRQER